MLFLVTTLSFADSIWNGKKFEFFQEGVENRGLIYFTNDRCIIIRGVNKEQNDFSYSWEQSLKILILSNQGFSATKTNLGWTLTKMNDSPEIEKIILIEVKND